MAASETTIPIIASRRTRLVIGIDFGTTFSGVCWALEGDTEVEVIQEWPGNGNTTSQKVPTILTLNHHDSKLWGYQIKDTKESVRGVKLLLDESKDISFKPALESEIILRTRALSPVKAAGEYLKQLISHAKLILDKRGIGSLMKTMDVQYILTVPAIWSDKAKDLTMQAAHDAGIPRSDLYLLSEPEAAAVYTIHTIQPNSIAKGDSFIVCDAGGGTVDLITYQVTQTEPMRMREVIAGTGEVCGSVILDELFEAFLSKRIGEDVYRTLPDVNKRHAMRRWQFDIKPSYSGSEDADEFVDAGYMVPVPGVPDLPEKGVFQGMLHMENEDVQRIFDPVVIRIEALIRDQEKRATEAGVAPKGILLVGGLGASGYLFKRLKRQFEKLDIMQPKNAWSAVVRGAVHRGLEGNQVQDRKARCHYGVWCSLPFQAGVHKESHKVWCPYDEKWLINNGMNWYILKGDSFSEGSPMKLPFFRSVPSSHSFVFHEELQASVLENPPEFYGNGVVKHCELKADLSKISREVFEKRANSKGEEYYHVVFELVLTSQSASLIFELHINSLSYGTVRARYY